MIKVTFSVEGKRGDYSEIKIRARMSDEEWSLLNELSNEKNIMDNMFREIAYLNPLGHYIYVEYQWEKGAWEIFVDGSDDILVPSTLINPEYIKEITRYVTMKLTEFLAVALDIEEIDEHIATIVLPDFVINQLKLHNIDHNFKIDLKLKKERGFNPIVVEQIATYPPNYEIEDVIKHIATSTNYLNIPLDDFDTNLKICYDKKIFIQHTDIRGKDLKDVANKIKTEIQQKIREIEERGDLNLVLAALYNKGLFYGHSDPIELFDEYAISGIVIERQYLFGNITVYFKLKTPFIEELWLNEAKSEVEVNTDEGKLRFVFNLSAPEREYGGQIIVPKDVRNKRIERLIKQDVSVIDEVKELDRRVVNQIVTGIKTQILDALIKNGIIIVDDSGRYAFNKKYTIKEFDSKDEELYYLYPETDIQVSSIDILDAINEKYKGKITAYLVAQKIKNSIMGD